MELLINYIRVLRRYWISVVAITLGGILTGGLVSILTTPVYSTSSSVIFSVPKAATPAELNFGSTYLAAQIKSYVELARTPLVLDRVIRQLELNDSAAGLAGRVTSINPPGTTIVTIGADGADAAQVARTATAVAQELMAAVDQISPRGSDGAKAVEATLVSPASVPSSPTSPRVIQNLALGLALGVVLGVGQAALREAFRTRGTRRAVDTGETEEPGADSSRQVDYGATDPDPYLKSLADLQRSVDAILARVDEGLRRDPRAVHGPHEPT